jgi:hypothetical protein
MPKAAAALNAATEILPLPKIGPRLTELFGSGAKGTDSKLNDNGSVIEFRAGRNLG